MSDLAIKVENLSKRYRIGLKEQRPETFVGAMTTWFKAPFTNFRQLRDLSQFSENGHDANDIIWALRDVSFEVKQGEVVGIIGRNGAGKSTLLKILSRITEPTAGRVVINGRVSSLLEVGTGFHPELTGRENVYLNGTVLGMSKQEIDRKFDEIVDFSGVEKFIDTPVKRYSSGMQVRLAFAVAAHLEPEILLVDEVLAVGDVEFQKKCMGKMSDVASGGRTVLLVSHNMLAIQSLCTKSVLIAQGRVVFDGQTDQAVQTYLTAIDQQFTTALDVQFDRAGEQQFCFTNIQFLNPETMKPWQVLMSGQPTIIRLGYRSTRPDIIKNVEMGVTFDTISGVHLFECDNQSVGITINVLPGQGYTDCILPKLPLKPGRYQYSLSAGKGHIDFDYFKNAGLVDVESGNYYNSGFVPYPKKPGVFVDYIWQHDEVKTMEPDLLVSND